MAAWSRDKRRHWIAEAAQAAHVPSFPLCEPGEHKASPQLRRADSSETVASLIDVILVPDEAEKHWVECFLAEYTSYFRTELPKVNIPPGWTEWRMTYHKAESTDRHCGEGKS
jgi:hypothetical protein